MASKDQGADKTEKPTAKRIRDARKEGNVSKSKDLTSTVLVLGWLLGGWLLMGFMGKQVSALFQLSLDSMHKPFLPALVELGWAAVQTLAWLVLPLVVIAVLLGLLVDFLQVGPLLAFKKVSPKMDKLNPA